MSDEHGTVISGEKARQGVKRHRMIWVLALSLGLALVILTVLMLWTWQVAPSVP